MEPAGPLSNALETLRGMLAALEPFQLFLGVAQSQYEGDDPDYDPIAAAKARTYLTSVPPAAGVSGGDGSQEYTPGQWENTLRPFALCYTSPTGGYRMTRESRYGFQDRGKLFVELERNAPNNADTDPETADRTVLNQIGAILLGLADVAGQASNLDLAEIGVAIGPSRERFEELGGTGQYYWTLLEITWGPD